MVVSLWLAQWMVPCISLTFPAGKFVLSVDTVQGVAQFSPSSFFMMSPQAQIILVKVLHVQVQHLRLSPQSANR
jgi:hypothetical protein